MTAPDSAGQLCVLLLCDLQENTANTVGDHVRGIEKMSRHRIFVVSSRGNLPDNLELDRFDAVILHYSLIISNDNYLSGSARQAIRHYSGLKIAFIQDDYRWINRTVSAIAYMRMNVVFGVAPDDVIDDIYSPAMLPCVRRETVLTGYVPVELTKLTVRPFADRRLDVGYRARKLPAWLGKHSQQKWQIADRFLEDAALYGLTCDISWRESDRIYGDAWIDFLTNCKAVLGTESGASVCDFTGEIQQKVERHEANAPHTPFDQMRELYFKDVDGKVVLSVISPRCFEAAALRTLMINYEGNYSGILKPWRHYVPLKSDHSNMAEVVEILRDREQAETIIDTAYREVALNPNNQFSAMVDQLDRVMEEEFHPSMAKSPSHDPAQLERWLNHVNQQRERRSRWRAVRSFVRRMLTIVLDRVSGVEYRISVINWIILKYDLWNIYKNRATSHIRREFHNLKNFLNVRNVVYFALIIFELGWTPPKQLKRYQLYRDIIRFRRFCSLVNSGDYSLAAYWRESTGSLFIECATVGGPSLTDADVPLRQEDLCGLANGIEVGQLRDIVCVVHNPFSLAPGAVNSETVFLPGLAAAWQANTRAAQALLGYLAFVQTVSRRDASGDKCDELNSVPFGDDRHNLQRRRK